MNVNVSETGVLNQALQVGDQTQQVQVSANAEAIQTETSTLGGVVGTQTITDLPLVTRNYQQILSISWRRSERKRWHRLGPRVLAHLRQRQHGHQQQLSDGWHLGE